MRRCCRVFIACFVIFLVSASIVSAREDAKPGLYVDGGASVYILDMPSYQPIATRNLAPSYTAINRLSVYDDNAVGMLGSLTLGWRTATPLYFELTGRTFEDQGHSQRYFNYAAYGADAVGISFPSGNLPTYFACRSRSPRAPRSASARAPGGWWPGTRWTWAPASP